MSESKPRYFVTNQTEQPILLGDFIEALEYNIDDGDTVHLTVVRNDMTDGKFDSLPDVSD